MYRPDGLNGRDRSDRGLNRMNWRLDRMDRRADDDRPNRRLNHDWRNADWSNRRLNHDWRNADWSNWRLNHDWRNADRPDRRERQFLNAEDKRINRNAPGGPISPTRGT